MSLVFRAYSCFELSWKARRLLKRSPTSRKAGSAKRFPTLELALEGRMDFDHRFLLGLQLKRLEHVDSDIAKVDDRIDERLKPYEEQHARPKQIPGVDHVLAATLIAELGVNMSVFHSDKHLAAWAGVCPGNNESAGTGQHSQARTR